MPKIAASSTARSTALSATVFVWSGYFLGFPAPWAPFPQAQKEFKTPPSPKNLAGSKLCKILWDFTNSKKQGGKSNFLNIPIILNSNICTGFQNWKTYKRFIGFLTLKNVRPVLDSKNLIFFYGNTIRKQTKGTYGLSGPYKLRPLERRNLTGERPLKIFLKGLSKAS